ncbi:MAG: MATE family efflux transporter, partial [Clostridia bacterium]|nr:MATE family efflux transporter [Clostridia bacterium]
MLKKAPRAARPMPDIEIEGSRDRTKLILQLMWPALAENVLSTLVSMADTIMVSTLGKEATAAVGLVTQPRFIMLAAFMALGTGSTALVARAKGRGDAREANQVLRQSLILSGAVIALLCAVMLVFCEPLIRFIAGAEISAPTIAMATDYLRVQIYGFPTLALTFVMTACLRGAGNTRAAFYANSASNIVNVIFNYLLIGGRGGFPALGVKGASIATVLGQIVALGFCLYLLMNGKQYITLRRQGPLRVDMTMIGRISRIGFPALLEQVIMRVGMMLFTLIATSQGTDAYAAHIIAMNIQSLSFTTGMSFGTAATTLTGQCLGRKRVDLAQWYVRRSLQLGAMVSVLVALILFFFGGALGSLYNKEPLIIGYVSTVLKIVALSNVISNSRFVYNAALRGAGDSRFTAVSTFFGILIARPLVASLLVFVFHLGLVGVWIALISDAVLCYILANHR